MLLLASLDFRETRNLRLTPITAVLLLPGYTVAAQSGLFWLAWLAAKLGICRESSKVVPVSTSASRTTTMDQNEHLLLLYQITSIYFSFFN